MIVAPSPTESVTRSVTKSAAQFTPAASPALGTNTAPISPVAVASHYDLTSLKAFCAVAREGSVSRAATRLHLTQPAVSLQIKALQERSALQLFSRTPKGLALTRDGAALLPQAEKVLSALQDFGQSARNLRSTLRGTLRIGTILDPEFTRLGEFLKQLVESAPQIDTELRQAISGEVINQLQLGSLDVDFYLATSAELQAYGTEQFRKKKDLISHLSQTVLAFSEELTDTVQMSSFLVR